MRGRFITFEGGEGSGKSTQIALLEKALKEKGIPVLRTREPGGSTSAEAVRSLLVSGLTDSWDAISETFLFYAARRDHIEKLIKPALAEGKTVLCDRFADSTMVYQGIAKGLSEPYIAALHRLAIGNFAPELTLILDIDPAEGLKRASARRGNETRFESLPLEFHRQIRAGFLSIAEREPARCAIFDASLPVEKLHAHILAKVMHNA